MDDHSDSEGGDVDVILIENDLAQEDVKGEIVETAVLTQKPSEVFQRAPDGDPREGRAGANALDEDDSEDADRKPANRAGRSKIKAVNTNPGAGGASNVDNEPALAAPATAGSSFIHVIRLPKSNVAYAQWTQHHLRLACKHRGVPNMSRSKDNAEMARRLEAVDRKQRRPSPYVGDFRQAGGSTSGRARGSLADSADSADSSRPEGADPPTPRPVPEGVKLMVQEAVMSGFSIAVDKPIVFGGVSYRYRDVIDAAFGQCGPGGPGSTDAGDDASTISDSTAIQLDKDKGKTPVSAKRRAGGARDGSPGPEPGPTRPGESGHRVDDELTVSSGQAKMGNGAPRLGTPVANEPHKFSTPLARKNASVGAVEAGAARVQIMPRHRQGSEQQKGSDTHRVKPAPTEARRRAEQRAPASEPARTEQKDKNASKGGVALGYKDGADARFNEECARARARAAVIDLGRSLRQERTELIQCYRDTKAAIRAEEAGENDPCLLHMLWTELNRCRTTWLELSRQDDH